MADEKVLIEIEVDNDQAVNDLETQNKELIQLEKNQKKLAVQRGKNSKQYQLNAQRIRQVRQERNANLKLIKAEANSLGKMKGALAAANKARDKVNLSTAEGQAEYKRLTAEINKYNTTLKKAEAQGNSFTRNVGNYTNGIKDAIPAFKGLNLAMLANPIGLIVAGFTALIGAFSKTEKGAKFLKTTMAVLNAIFDTLVGYVGELAGAMIDTFSNPVESIKSFANLVQNYVLEKVNALIDTFGFLSDVVRNVFQGDFEAALDSAKKAGESFAKSQPIVDLFEATSEVVSDVTEKITDNVTATIKLEDATWKLQRAMLATQKEVKRLEGQEAVLASRAEDSTLSFQEQAKAQEQLILVQQKKFKTQENLISQEISLIQTQLDIAKRNNQDTLQLQQELTAKQLELTENRNQARLSETENNQITRQRNQDIWEQELDFIIDVGEREREVFAQRAADENLTVEQRKQALANYQAAYDQFLQAQRSQFNELGLSDEELNRLLGIKDPAELAEAITGLNTLSEVEKNRLREVLIEFKNSELERAKVAADAEKSITNTAKIEANARLEIEKQVANQKAQLLNSGFALAKQIAGKNEKLAKAIGLVEVAINTARGITQAFAQLGPVAGIPAAAVVAATGVTQALAITNASLSGGGSVSGPPSLPNANSQQPNTTNADNQLLQQQALENAIANLGLTISVTEINNAQSNVALSESTASI